MRMLFYKCWIAVLILAGTASGQVWYDDRLDHSNAGLWRWTNSTDTVYLCPDSLFVSDNGVHKIRLLNTGRGWFTTKVNRADTADFCVGGGSTDSSRYLWHNGNTKYFPGDSFLLGSRRDTFKVLVGDTFVSLLDSISSRLAAVHTVSWSASLDTIKNLWSQRDSVDTLKATYAFFGSRCSVSGKVVLAKDTIYYGVLTARSPARFHTVGPIQDTAIIFTRDSSGTRVLKAWMSNLGVWHKANGDSAYYGQGGTGGGVWGEITGTLSAQTDLNTALLGKQNTNEKGAANGYPSLDANAKVPTLYLGGSGADNTKYLRGDQTWATPAGGGGGTDIIGVTVDGGGSVFSTGSKGYREMPYNCTIVGWTVLGKESGSVVMDVRKCNYAGFPTTTSIAGSEKPTLSSQQKNQDMNLSTWNTAISAGDILEFVIESASTVKRVHVNIKITIP